MQPRILVAFSVARALLAHVQPGVPQDPHVLFCQAGFQLGGPQHVLANGVVPAQVQGSAVPLVEINPPVLDLPMLVGVFCSHTIKQAGTLMCLKNNFLRDFCLAKLFYHENIYLKQLLWLHKCLCCCSKE